MSLQKNQTVEEEQIKSGLDFILSHLSGPPFPRKIMSSNITEGQRAVSYKDVAISYFEGAFWKDCRISAFCPGQRNPDLIFIDLDAKDFCSMRAFKAALTRTLNRIEKKIRGHPTVLWSGNGYHVIQPIDCKVDLDNVKEFADLGLRDSDINKAFLQFASNYLSNGKRDKCNRVSLNSCQMRIPGSLNTKCNNEGSDPEVKILQQWDGFRPDYRLLHGSFYAHLVGKREQERAESLAHHCYDNEDGTGNGQQQQREIPWIERLLQTPIEDYRQCSRDLIIVPYLVLRKGIRDVEQTENTVMLWADKCAELRSLQPSRHEFAKRVRSRAYEVARHKIPAMKWSTVQADYPDLAKKLSKREEEEDKK